MTLQPLKSSMTAELEAEPRSDSAGPAFPLLQVCLGGPDSGIVGHVVVGGEELHLLPVRTVLPSNMTTAIVLQTHRNSQDTEHCGSLTDATFLAVRFTIYTK